MVLHHILAELDLMFDWYFGYKLRCTFWFMGADTVSVTSMLSFYSIFIFRTSEYERYMIKSVNKNCRISIQYIIFK